MNCFGLAGIVFAGYVLGAGYFLMTLVVEMWPYNFYVN